MANIEFGESDLLTAAKAFGCEQYLPKNFPTPKLKEPSFYDRYVQDAMSSGVSFSPDEQEVTKVSYAELLKKPTRSERRINNGWNLSRGDSTVNMMTGKPGHDKG